MEATTGKAASGAKVATNSKLAHRMRDIIDIDTGPIISGEKTIQQMGEEILEYCI